MKALLSISEILSQSWKELQERFLPMFILAALIPFSMWLLNGILRGFDPMLFQSQTPSFSLQIIVSLLSVFVSLYVTAALLLFISKQASTLSEALFIGLRKLPRLLLGLCMYGGAILFIIFLFIILLSISSSWLGGTPEGALSIAVLGVLLMMVGLIVIGIYLTFLPYILILTDTPLLKCFLRSYQLVKNHFWNTVGLLVTVAILNAGITILCYLMLGLIGLVAWILLPASRYVFPIFFVLPAAMAMLVHQVPLLILYKNRSSVIFEE